MGTNQLLGGRGVERTDFPRSAMPDKKKLPLEAHARLPNIYERFARSR
jgi:hypothetical protein